MQSTVQNVTINKPASSFYRPDYASCLPTKKSIQPVKKTHFPLNTVNTFSNQGSSLPFSYNQIIQHGKPFHAKIFISQNHLFSVITLVLASCSTFIQYSQCFQNIGQNLDGEGNQKPGVSGYTVQKKTKA